jgi:iron complex outermembrane receptor protein
MVSGCAIVASLAMPHLALAQVSDQPAAPEAESTSGLSDIVVTATRRETNVQDVPIAISAIGGDELMRRGISDPTALTGIAPSLTVDAGAGAGNVHASIRGLASTEFNLGASSPVATYIDDVYQPFQFGVGNQLYDLNRVEVLRGPQGTLFGKNSTGGALSFYSQAPTDKVEGYFLIDAGGGDFGHYAVEGAFNRPLGDNLSMRISGRADRRDNYINNLQLGSEAGSKLGHYTNYSGRVQFAWDPGADTSVSLKLYGLQNNGDGAIWLAEGLFAEPESDRRNVFAETPFIEKFHNYGATLRVDQNFGDFTLTSVTAAQRAKYLQLSNGDGVGSDFFASYQTSKVEQISQEIRLATPAEKPLRAVLGLYGMHDDIDSMTGSGNPRGLDVGLPESIGGGPARQKTTSYAAFASATLDVSEQLSLIGGLRYSYDRKRIAGYVVSFGLGSRDYVPADLTDVPGALATYGVDPLLGDILQTYDVKRNWSRVTWDATVNFKPTEDTLLFAKVSTGYRAGGFPVGLFSVNTFSTVDPEKLISYELGWKSEFFDNKVRLNGSAYIMDYDDMQVQVLSTDITAIGNRLANAGSARIKGIEAELQLAPLSGLLMSASVGYNKAVYTRYLAPDVTGTGTQDLSGRSLPYAPRWTASGSVSYETSVSNALKFVISTDWNYRSRVYFDSPNSRPGSDDPRVIGNARIGIGAEDDSWRLTGYVKNVTNKLSRFSAFDLGVLVAYTRAPLRTWGVQADFRF